MRMPSLFCSVIPRLDRGIHLPSRLATTLCVALMASLASPALAAPIAETHYRETMAALAGVQTLMLETIDAIHSGLSPEDAQTRLPHMRERLQWMRDAKVDAARADTRATLRNMNPENRRARCIIMRAGLMDEAFQDVLVNVTLKARGLSDAELLPLDRKAAAEFGLPGGCPR